MFIQPCLNCLVSVLSFKILSILLFHLSSTSSFPQTLLVTSRWGWIKKFLFYYKNDSFFMFFIFFGNGIKKSMNIQSWFFPTSQSDYRVILINSFSRFYCHFLFARNGKREYKAYNVRWVLICIFIQTCI